MQRLVLKVTLCDISPPIWRRVDVPADISLAQFHRVLQIVMGWTNSHLHEFEQGTDLYGTSDRDFGIYRISETSTRVGDVLATPGARLDYHYDFGDSWYHAIVVEQVLDDGADEVKPVVLLGGRRACPPEDCGGPYAYMDFLAALADPGHPEHAVRKEWVGGRWDAEHMPAVAITRRLARLKLKAVVSRAQRRPRVVRDLPGVDPRVLDFFKRGGRP